MFTTLFRSLKKTVRRRGILGTAPWLLRQAYKRAWDLTPARVRKHADRAEADRQFDRRYHVDTSGVIPLYRLEVDSENWIFGGRYQAILPGEFHEMLAVAGDVAAGRVFVDFGSGKGRAMLLAAEYPFERIVGVEFCPQLVDVARQNLLSYRNPGQCCRNLEVVLCDATRYPIPETPVVLFLFNPFEYEVMTRVVDNVRQSLEQHPRPATVIYGNPNDNRDLRIYELWDRVPALTRKVSHGYCSVYHTS